ncbi:tRNA (guanine-N(7)-)-methyltransferase (tRNA(m7G46)-methyltransferase) [Coemansia sp. RSA 1933]|nr:tRNA (guanine-N(7)-)-methyltransferase (tRNA(m7G46)-methyltransferase) [Coemansia sp. RSA 1933]
MCIAILANVRAVVGYVVLLTVALGCAVATLLAANIATSYWFQHRRERQRLGPAMDGGGKESSAAPGARLPLDPPVHRIPRLTFASLVPAATQTTLLLPTAYNTDTWTPPVLEHLHGYPQVQSEVVQLVHLVVRDFVHKWFGDISADPSFPRCVQAQVTQAIDAVAERVRDSHVDPAELVVAQVLPLATAHIHAVRTATESVDTADTSLEARITRAYASQPGIRWHAALASAGGNSTDGVLTPDECRLAVRMHVRRVVDLIVPLVLAPEQSGLAAHRVLVREILTGAVLAPAVTSFADPDTINQLLGSQLERLIREQHMVSELREALDKQASVVDGAGASDSETTPVSPEAGENGEEGTAVMTYEQFMASIDECTDDAQVARILDDIVAQIRKRRILIMGHGKNDVVHGQKVRDILVYVNRLYVAKKKAERRLELLASSQSQKPLLARPVAAVAKAMSRASTYYEHRDDPQNLGPPQFTLREILTNVASLSAFAEYMDLIGSQLALEFWVNVEGAKQTARSTTDTDAGILPSIVGSLWKNYFTVRVDELASLGTDIEASIGNVQRCLKPHKQPASMDLDLDLLTAPLCHEAFELVALVQDAVFRHMQMGVFPSFLRSAIYSRFLKEYYVTPRHDQISASLFEPQSAIATDDERSQKSDSSRKRSIVRSVAGSLGRVRSVSGASLGPGIFRRARPEAPIVSTDTAQATRTLTNHTGRSSSAAQLAALAEAVPEHITPPPQQQQPVVPQLSRRSTRVGPSEVRRLSASLRSIGLGDVAAADRVMSAESELPPPIAEDPLDEDHPLETAVLTEEPVDDTSAPVQETANDDVTPQQPDEATAENEEDVEEEEELSADEAESLVLARVIRTPTPGDLFLDERIEQLARDLERKTHQMAIVRALMRQAESRHKPHEQRVLAASFRGLRREVQAGAEQQRLYEASLDDHFLSAARTRVHIPRAITTVDSSDDSDPSTHVVYLIELQQSMAAEHTDSSSAPHAPTGWVVSRRYREFFQMHKDLRAAYAAEMRGHDLPSRTPLIRLQRDRDIEHRRTGLQKYIQGLLHDPHIANTRPVRLFLSSTQPPSPQARDGLARDNAARDGTIGEGYESGDGAVAAMSGWMAQIYKTVGEDIEGITGADSMLEIIVQELGAKVAMQQPSDDTLDVAALRDYAIVSAGVGPSSLDVSAPGFIDPLSDLFVEVFGLKNRRNWLRRQAISILLRHIVGGTVERRVRDMVGSTVRDAQIGGLVANLRSTLWPSDPRTLVPGPFQGFSQRTDLQRQEAARDARARILWFLPRVLAGMVGKKNARDGASLLADVVQHPIPNLNLILHVFDVLVAAIFPEIKFQLESHHPAPAPAN